MPLIIFRNERIEVPKNSNLRKVLLKHELGPHNGQARWFNCKGMGTCGTCAIAIKGKVSEMTAVERWRLNFPPHQPSSGLRLACQCRVLGDLHIQKHQGFWGHLID